MNCRFATKLCANQALLMCRQKGECSYIMVLLQFERMDIVHRIKAFKKAPYLHDHLYKSNTKISALLLRIPINGRFYVYVFSRLVSCAMN